MSELPTTISAKPNAARLLIRPVALTLVIGLFCIAGGYAVGRRVSGNALLQEVFADISPALFSGKIVSIDLTKRQLTVIVEGVQGVMLPKIYQQKQFTIRPDAKISARRTRSNEEFAQEFARLKSANNGPVEPPLPYTEQEIKAEELRIGEMVRVAVDSAAKQTVLDGAFAAIQINVNR